MKKIVAVILVMAMFFSFAGCKSDTANKEFKFGVGAVSDYNYTNTPETEYSYSQNGISITTTAAAVTVDKNGKIVECKIDCMDFEGADYRYFGTYADWVIPRMISADRMQSEILDNIDIQFYNYRFRAFYDYIDVNDSQLPLTRKEELASRYPIAEEMPIFVLTSDVRIRELAQLSWIIETHVPEYTIAERDADHEQMGYSYNYPKIYSKRELGDDYGMKLYGSEKEWYEQADAFEKLCIGKDIDEVKALVLDGGELVKAGCTIDVNDFVLAVEKAYNNAESSNVTAEDNIELVISCNVDMDFDEELDDVSAVNFDICVSGTAKKASGKTVESRALSATISMPARDTVDTSVTYEAEFETNVK